MRRILEPAAAAMAAQSITRRPVLEMQEAIDASHQDATPEELLTSDIKFHRLVGSASGNAVLASLLEGLSAPTNRARVWRGRTQTGAHERTVREHQAILDALVAGRARPRSCGHGVARGRGRGMAAHGPLKNADIRSILLRMSLPWR